MLMHHMFCALFLLLFARKRAASNAPSGGSAKKAKSGKADKILPAVQAEYNGHLEKLDSCQLDAAKLAADVTSWGKKKGGLISAGLAEAADTVATMCKHMSKLLACKEADTQFMAKLDASAANNLVVKLDALDSTIRSRLPEPMVVASRVAQATVEAAGGNVASGCIRILGIERDGARVEEVTGYFRRHYNKSLSRADGRGVKLEPFKTELVHQLQPILDGIAAAQDPFQKIPELVKPQLKAIGAWLQPSLADEPELAAASKLLESDESDEMGIVRAFRVYEIGKQLVDEANAVQGRLQKFEPTHIVFSTLADLVVKVGDPLNQDVTHAAFQDIV